MLFLIEHVCEICQKSWYFLFQVPRNTSLLEMRCCQEGERGAKWRVSNYTPSLIETIETEPILTDRNASVFWFSELPQIIFKIRWKLMKSRFVDNFSATLSIFSIYESQPEADCFFTSRWSSGAGWRIPWPSRGSTLSSLQSPSCPRPAYFV